MVSSSKVLLLTCWQWYSFPFTHAAADLNAATTTTTTGNVSLRNRLVGADHTTADDSPASSVNLTLVFFLVITLLLLGLIAVVVYWLYCTKGGKKGKLFPWSKSSKSKSHKSSKKSQYPQTEESIKAERRAAVFS